MERDSLLGRMGAWMLVLGLALAAPLGAVTLQPDGSPTSGDPNLRLWLNTGVAGSLYQDTAGTIAVTDGSPVALWQDQSGNSFDVSQASAGNRPSYTGSVGTLNGQPAVDFTGGPGGDALSRANDIGVSGNGDRTVITVWENTGFTGQNYQHTFHMGTPSGNQAYGHSASRGGGAGSPIGNHYYGAGFDSTADANLDPNFAISIWDGNGGTGTNGLDSWWVNGKPAGASDRAPLNTGTAQLHVGSRLNPFTEGFTGHLAEVIVYDAAVTGTERAQLEGYIESKYALNQAQVKPNGQPIQGDPRLKAWYRADAGVNTTGTSVTSWIDQSTIVPDANRTLNANSGNEPTFVPGEGSLANQPVVSFDGINDYLFRNTGNSPVTGNADRTIFAVITNKQPGPVANKEHVLHFGTTATNQAYGVVVEAGGPNIGNHYWGSGFYAGPVASTAAPTALTFVYDGEGVGGLTGLDSFFVNGLSAGTVDILAQVTGTGALNTGTDQFTLGSRINPLTEHLNGDIAEILIYDSKLPQHQIDLIHGYLALKYGLDIEGAVDVPEPSTLALAAFGFAALARRRRRRN
jgi:hypothetical protein